MKKVIIITGGNSGVGKATAQLLAKKHTVVILGRNAKEIEKVSKALKCTGFVCDITDEQQIKKTFDAIIKKYKKVDCLINCAGTWTTGPIEKNTPEEIKNVMAVNAIGTMLMVNAFGAQFKKQKKGRIINVISQAGLEGKAERSVYYASKWAVTGFTKSIQLEFQPFNVSVVGFYPGFIHTDIFKKGGDGDKDFSKAMRVEQPAKAIAYLVEIDDDVVVDTFEMEHLKSL